MKNLSIRKILLWAVLAVAAIFIVYRLKFSPTLITAHIVTTGEIRREVMGTGTLEARVKTTISPRIQERLAEVLVDQNDRVTAGQLLARLDDGELKRQVEVTIASLAAARASLDRVKTDEARSMAVEKQAQLDHRRASDLLTSKVASQADFDKATEQLNVARADVKRSQAAIVEAERQVVMAEQSLLYQRERLSFTQIISPYDGLIIRRDRDPGGVAVPGSSILQLIATNEIWVSAWVDETAIAHLSAGQPARIIFRSEPGKCYPGEVARLGREADRETREFLVDVRVNQLPPNWTVGQRAEVIIETGRKAGVVLAPQQFVLWRDGKTGVFVNDHGKARWRDLNPGFRGLNDLEIAQGLSGGEQIVKPLQGQRKPLAEGQRIRAP